MLSWSAHTVPYTCHKKDICISTLRPLLPLLWSSPSLGDPADIIEGKDLSSQTSPLYFNFMCHIGGGRRQLARSSSLAYDIVVASHKPNPVASRTRIRQRSARFPMPAGIPLIKVGDRPPVSFSIINLSIYTLLHINIVIKQIDCMRNAPGRERTEIRSVVRAEHTPGGRDTAEEERHKVKGGGIVC